MVPAALGRPRRQFAAASTSVTSSAVIATLIDWPTTWNRL